MMRFGVDVAEYWLHSVPLQSVHRQDEDEGGDNNFASESVGADGELQTRRPPAGRDAVLNTQHTSEAPLELLNVRPGVCQPTVGQRILDQGQQTVTVREVGSTNMNGLGKRRWLPENHQVIECVLGVHRGRPHYIHYLEKVTMRGRCCLSDIEHPMPSMSLHTRTALF